VNYPKAISQGFELTYNYNPTFRKGNPLSYYATYANGSVKLRKRGSLDSLGRVITADRASFDQQETMNLGVNYRLPEGSTVGLNAYVGTGLYGSRRPNGQRQGITEVNFKYSSSPRLFRNAYGIDISIENLFDQKDRYNYFSDYEGIRYQVGRRIITSIYSRF